MKFSIGDSVKLTVDKDYGDEKIPAGTRGIVEEVYELSKSYKVKFRGHAKTRRVLERDLKSA
jgi:hypothetical protein